MDKNIVSGLNNVILPNPMWTWATLYKLGFPLPVCELIETSLSREIPTQKYMTLLSLCLGEAHKALRYVLYLASVHSQAK